MRFTGNGKAAKACEGMLIIARPESLASLAELADNPNFPELATYACGNDAAVPARIIAGASVLIVEVDPASSRSIERLAELGRSHPDMPRIAAIPNTSLQLVRALMHEGVSDVVSLPFQSEEMLDVAVRVIELAKKREVADVRLCPVIAVLRSTGGCGATTIATHLAADLAAQLSGRRQVGIVDLDLQSGMIADYLGSSGGGSVADLLSAGERLDEDLLRSTAQTCEANLAVFAAPARIEPIESVDTDQLLRLLTMMRKHYAGLVLDLPSDWTNWSLSAASAADLIVVVVELTITSLRQAKRRLQLFAEVGIDPKKVVLVVNRVERRMFRSVDLSDVDTTLTREVLGTLALEEPAIASAQTQGLLVRQISRKSKFAADLSAIAGQVRARLPFRED